MESYKELIDNVLKTRGRFACGDIYHERHHIIPKCMGGTDGKDNLIDLFAREHFEAHRLLALENPDNDKLIYAWNMMAVVKSKNQNRYELTAEEYEEVKIACAKMQSETKRGENHPNYGKPMSEEQKEKIRIAKANISDETRRKLSESHKGIFDGENNPMYGRTWWDENTPQEKIDEWKLHLSEVNSGENHPMYGKHHSEETKEKLRISHLRENLSPETLKKMQQSHQDMHGENNPMFGKHHSEETKEKISMLAKERFENPENHPFYGRSHTEETKRKMSESKKGVKQWNSRALNQYTLNGELIKRWDYLLQASEGCCIDPGCIRRCCEGIYNHAGGFLWRYQDEYNEDYLHFDMPKPKNKGSVIQLDKNNNFIDEYYCVAELARVKNFDSSSINKCCNGKIKSYHGYQFVRKEMYELFIEEFGSNLSGLSIYDIINNKTK